MKAIAEYLKSTPRLTLERVSKRYAHDTNAVLRDVNLIVNSGDLIELSGRNGTGKSTLLKVAAGLTSATGGRVDRGSSILAYAPSAALETSRFTAYSYLRRMLLLRRLWSTRTRSAVHEIAALIGLTPGLDARLARLSTGNRKKVLLMQAFLAQADLILLDEPFDGLDAPAREASLGLFRMALDKGAALLVTSHTPEVANLGRRLTLHHGTLIESHTLGNSGVRVVVSVRLANENWRVLPSFPVSIAKDVGEFEVAEHEVPVLLRAVLDLEGEVLRLERRTRL